MYLIMLVVSMLLPMRVSAQTVKGKLVDESNHPLPYANVVLLSLPDSAFVSGTISGEDGLFKLEATSVNQIVKYPLSDIRQCINRLLLPIWVSCSSYRMHGCLEKW